MDENVLRIEARFKNARLYNAIEAASVPLKTSNQARALQRFGPVFAFCELHALSYNQVSDLLNLKIGPFLKNRWATEVTPRPVCVALANALDSSIEYLFPPELYARTWPRGVAIDVSPSKMVSLDSVPRRLLLEAPEQERTLVSGQLSSRLAKVIDTLTPREAKVIRLHYGIDGPERTMEEIGVILGVSRERIRQIEAKAMRKLRHPMRTGRVMTFIDADRSAMLCPVSDCCAPLTFLRLHPSTSGFWGCMKKNCGGIRSKDGAPITGWDNAQRWRVYKASVAAQEALDAD